MAASPKTPEQIALERQAMGMVAPNQSVADPVRPQPGMMSANPAPPTTYGTNPASAPNSRTVRPGGSGVFMAPTKGELDARRAAAVAAHEQRYAGQNPAAMTPAQQREYMRSAENARNQQKYRDLANPQAVDFNGQQLPHGSVVGSKGGTLISTPNGMAAQGKNGEALQFIEDPNTTGIVPTSVGMSPEEYDSALTDDQKTLVDEALTSIPGAVGKTFETLVQRRDAILGAANLTEAQRQQELAKVEGEIARARHSALSNPASVRAVKSGLDEVRRKKDEETSKTNEGIETAAKKLREDERAEFERKVAEEIARTQNPYDKRTPEQIRNDAEKAILGGGASDPRKPEPGRAISPPLGVAMGGIDLNSDGTLGIQGVDGTWFDGEILPDGSLAIRPQNEREEELIPDGMKVVRKVTKSDPKTGMTTSEDVVTVKTGSKAHKPKAPKPEAERMTTWEYELILKEKQREFSDKLDAETAEYKKAHAQWQIKKATDENNDRDKKIDPALWLQANPEPQPPKRTMADASAFAESEREKITGLSKDEFYDWCINRSNARTRFELVDGKTYALVDGERIPAHRTPSITGGVFMGVRPETPAQHKVAVLNDLPIPYGELHLDNTDLNDVNAVIARSKYAFPSATNQEIVEFARWIVQNKDKIAQ